MPTSRVVGPVSRFTGSSAQDYACFVVRNENRQPDSIRYGPGVIPPKQGCPTSRHIFRGGVGQVVVRRADGQAWNARFVAVDLINDLERFPSVQSGVSPG